MLWNGTLGVDKEGLPEKELERELDHLA